ncbi:thiamine phosphate synthase [Pseudaestuariivita atlantica]|uniref:Thiamine-phosphate pyrophosphorylase n=1 Tax=Pseudaestuariivita atlantica TaxID=1317121 RepID=A0A0L1JTK9_9RHOB|nr:thiamine phosphate synthase [Pseudaestuariivita atlantica]KNG95017.1 thiamine-phosphate pyrophosphorylase [Pseudaestuariivita atlantica]
MPDADTPQIYLLTPDEIDLSRFLPRFNAVLDAQEVACVRLALATRDEDRITRTADALREVTHARDIALVIDTHLALVGRLGLDGVHLGDGARTVRHARKELGPDAIVGAHCGASRHDGMSAGEAGADYVSFGPLTPGLLDTGDAAEDELFAWWSEMIEVPVVAEGGLDADIVARLAPFVDFFGIGAEIWSADNPVTALSDLVARLR